MPLEGMADRAPPYVRGHERRAWLLVGGLVLLTGIAGVLIVLTTGGLLGPILIMGAVGAVGVLALPAAIENVARWLSTGTVRRR